MTTRTRDKKAPEQEQSVADVVLELKGAKRRKAQDALRRAEKLSSIKSDADKELKVEANTLREILGEATVATINGVPVFTNRWRFETKVDKNALKERYVQVWNAVTSVAKSRYLDRSPGSTIKS